MNRNLSLDQVLTQLQRLTFFLLLFMIVAIAWQTSPMADDFCFKYLVSRYTLFEFINDYYLNWSGRITSTVFLQLVFSHLSPESFNVISLFYAILYVSILFAITRWICRWQLLPVRSIYVFNGVLITVSFPLSRLLSETVYWATGGSVYVVSYGFLFLFLGLMLQIYFTSTIKRYDWLAAPVIGFAAALALESVALTQVAILTVLCVYSLYQKKTKWFWFWSLLWASTVAGLGIVLAAPGNRMRLLASGSIGAEARLEKWPAHFIELFSERGSYLFEALIASFIIAVLLFILRDRTTPTAKGRRGDVLLALASALLAQLGLLTYLGPLAPPRTYSLFLILLSIFSVLSFFTLLEKLWTADRGRLILANGSFVLLNLYFASFFINEGFKAHEIKMQLLQRLYDVRAQPEKRTWEFPQILTKRSRVIHFDDLDEQSEHWKNQCFSNAMGIDSARIK